MVKFAYLKDRSNVWAARKELKGSSIFIRDDVSKETAKYRATLVPILKAARSANMKSSLSGDTLIVNGKKYPKGQLDRLPESLSPLNTATKSNESTLAFFGQACPLSNFHACSFTIDNIEYNSSEQYYQAMKANYNNRPSISDKIMQSADPAEQKRLGSQINVVGEKWNSIAPEIMHNGILEKFKQNDNLLEFLQNTGNKTLHEASPKDSHWGIGIPLSHSKVLDPAFHKGDNILGRILMSVREQLKSISISDNDFLPPNFTTSPVPST
jgi:hypothetical protein